MGVAKESLDAGSRFVAGHSRRLSIRVARRTGAGRGKESLRGLHAFTEELARALGIPAENAGAIVRYREENGNFKSLEGLKRVPGIDVKRIEDSKDWIEF